LNQLLHNTNIVPEGKRPLQATHVGKILDKVCIHRGKDSCKQPNKSDQRKHMFKEWFTNLEPFTYTETLMYCLASSIVIKAKQMINE
jgi:hypothetical protein